ncbi:alpha/beta hydrolase [Thioalkalivibrio sp.]|uniref:alpha/beta hydrolase n=1 Tax=Thioalkalivibrio sp. TaxID=2093813 RepID=UPI0039768590
MPARSNPRPAGIAATGLIAALVLPLTTGASDDPFDDDSLWAAPGADSNRGTLNFLGNQPDGRVHHHENQITVAASSLDDGWVNLRQCHRDIDRVGRAQILYNAATTRDIEIESQSNIEETWVEGASVQLRRVQPDAELCIRARSQMLTILDEGGYTLENGPFMRRFLDGYFPMRVTVAVNWGDLGLALARSEPEPQPGFLVTESEHGVIIDATFEGRLTTVLRLVGSDGP